MPASSLFTLIDDIASVLDDVALMTKVAAKKTAKSPSARKPAASASKKSVKKPGRR